VHFASGLTISCFSKVANASAGCKRFTPTSGSLAHVRMKMFTRMFTGQPVRKPGASNTGVKTGNPPSNVTAVGFCVNPLCTCKGGVRILAYTKEGRAAYTEPTWGSSGLDRSTLVYPA